MNLASIIAAIFIGTVVVVAIGIVIQLRQQSKSENHRTSSTPDDERHH